MLPTFVFSFAQLQSLLMIANPEFTIATSPVSKPSPNPVSAATDAGIYFVIPITSDGGAMNANTAAYPGFNYDDGTMTLGNTEDSAALSIAGFHQFRSEVIDMINILDNKIREILSASNTVQCP